MTYIEPFATTAGPGPFTKRRNFQRVFRFFLTEDKVEG